MEKALEARPMCAVCGRQVDRMLEDESADELVLTAICHGERQRIRLGPQELAAIGKIDLGWAFVTPGNALPPIPQARQRAIGPITP